MKNFIMKNKVVLAIIAIILVGALLVGVIVWGGGAGNNDNTNPTGDSQGTTQGTEDPSKPSDATKPSDGTEPSDATGPSNATDPSENTNPTENTEPTEGTEPSQGTEPTDPSQGATEPTVTNPPATEPSVKPTEPKPTEPAPTQPKPTEPQPTQPKPTEPKPTEPKPTEPKPTEPKPTNPPETEPPVVTQPSTYPTEPDEGDGYKGVTPENMLQSDLTNWDVNDWAQFDMKFYSGMTPEQKYTYINLENNGGIFYSCGTAGHRCLDEYDHQERITQICRMCGQTECNGWYIFEDNLLQGFHEQLCDAYSEYKDPFKYCQRCGKRSTNVDMSITDTCNWQIGDGNCYYCGKWVQGHTCHTCKAEDVKEELKYRVW